MGLGEADDRLHRGDVEAVGVDVVIGRRRDDDVIGTGQRRGRVGRGGQVQRAAGQEILQLGIDDRRGPGIDHRHPLGRDVDRDDLVMLRQQDGVRQADIAQAKNGNLHSSHPTSQACRPYAVRMPPWGAQGTCDCTGTEGRHTTPLSRFVTSSTCRQSYRPSAFTILAQLTYLKFCVSGALSPSCATNRPLG